MGSKYGNIEIRQSGVASFKEDTVISFEKFEEIILPVDLVMMTCAKSPWIPVEVPIMVP